VIETVAIVRFRSTRIEGNSIHYIVSIRIYCTVIAVPITTLIKSIAVVVDFICSGAAIAVIIGAITHL